LKGFNLRFLPLVGLLKAIILSLPLFGLFLRLLYIMSIMGLMEVLGYTWLM
jgi:hypothetical protein